MFPTRFEIEERDDRLAPTDDDTDRLHGGKHDRDVTGDLRDLASSRVTLLGEFLQLGDDQCEKLHYDKRVDEREYSQRKQRRALERAARHRGQDAEEVVLEDGLHLGGAQPRHGNVTAYSIHQKERQRQEYLDADLLGLERVFQSLQHIIQLPLLCRLPFRSSQWRNR